MALPSERLGERLRAVCLAMVVLGVTHPVANAEPPLVAPDRRPFALLPPQLGSGFFITSYRGHAEVRPAAGGGVWVLLDPEWCRSWARANSTMSDCADAVAALTVRHAPPLPALKPPMTCGLFLVESEVTQVLSNRSELSSGGAYYCHFRAESCERMRLFLRPVEQPRDAFVFTVSGLVPYITLKGWPNWVWRPEDQDERRTRQPDQTRAQWRSTPEVESLSVGSVKGHLDPAGRVSAVQIGVNEGKHWVPRGGSLHVKDRRGADVTIAVDAVDPGHVPGREVAQPGSLSISVAFRATERSSSGGSVE